MKRVSYSLLLLFLVSCKTNYKTFEELSLKAKLEVLFPKSEVTSIQTNDHFKEAYQVVLEQNLNPKNKKEGTFKHYMYISNVDYKNPTVLITDGYASRNRTTELSKLLKANQVIVEYRMYGKSRPDSIPWKYLTNDNAIEDYHSIVSKLKKIYTGIFTYK